MNPPLQMTTVGYMLIYIMTAQFTNTVYFKIINDDDDDTTTNSVDLIYVAAK